MVIPALCCVFFPGKCLAYLEVRIGGPKLGCFYYSKKCHRRNGWTLEYPTGFDILGHPFMLQFYLAKNIFQLRISKSENSLNKWNQERILTANFKILTWLGYRNCLKHWTSLGMLIMLVSERGMNFSASQELTTEITPTNPKVSEALAFFSKSRSNTLLLAQELSAVLNN